VVDRISSLTEKGVLCDETHSADARRTVPRNYAETTILLEEKKLGLGTVAYRVAALRFFYVRTLKRPDMKEDLPCPHAPKHTRRLPTILTPEEVSRLMLARPQSCVSDHKFIVCTAQTAVHIL
jgi:site-specific recombinase XerC